MLNLSEKKHRKKTDNLSIRMYKNKIENGITFKTKTGYYIELLMLETMKLLGGTEKSKNKSKNVENVPYLEITWIVLIHCNIVDNDYQGNLRVLYTFVPNKSFSQVWFTDQNSRKRRHRTTCYSVWPRDRIFVIWKKW